GATPPALTAQQIDLRDWARKLGQTRTASRALRRGARTTLVAEPDLWVYAYEAGPKEIAVVVVNRGGDVSGRFVSQGALSLGGVASWQAALGTGSAAKSDGGLTISLAAGQAAIFLAK